MPSLEDLSLLLGGGGGGGMLLYKELFAAEATLTDWLSDDRLYSAILRSLEQAHCARMWFYMSD